MRVSALSLKHTFRHKGIGPVADGPWQLGWLLPNLPRLVLTVRNSLTDLFLPCFLPLDPAQVLYT